TAAQTPCTPRSTPPHHPGPKRPRSPHHHSGVKLTATLSLPWFTAVKADPLTWAVLLWFEAPEPTACCCVVAELPKLSPPTPLPTTPATALAAVALDPLSATAPLSAVATPVKRAAGSGRAETAAMTRAVRMLRSEEHTSARQSREH